MPDFLRTLWLMVETSWRADWVRSIGAVTTVCGQMSTLPLRAVGLRLMVDGITGQNFNQAITGGLVVAGFSGLQAVLNWWSLAIRMRLREHTQAYLDTHMMELTAGIPGLEHHERPGYLNRIELLELERHYIANPFNLIAWSVGGLVQLVSVIILLGSVHPLLMLMPLAGIPSVVASIKGEQEAARLREESAEPERTLRHLMELTTEAAAAKGYPHFRSGRNAF